MVLMLSSFALFINPQVFITTILPSSSCTTSLLFARNWPISTSLSYTFLEQPRVTTFILFFFRVLVRIFYFGFTIGDFRFALFDFKFMKVCKDSLKIQGVGVPIISEVPLC